MAEIADVQKKIRKRRQIADLNDFLEHHEKAKNFLDNVDEVSQWMASAVAATLGSQLEELNTGPSEFRSSLQRCCRRVLVASAGRTERVIFFHEAIPGFTVLAVKKDGWGEGATAPAKPRTGKTKEATQANEQERNEAIQAIIGSYVNRTGNRVLAIEGADVVLVFFPVADLRKNLEEMGFWSP